MGPPNYVGILKQDSSLNFKMRNMVRREFLGFLSASDCVLVTQDLKAFPFQKENANVEAVERLNIWSVFVKRLCSTCPFSVYVYNATFDHAGRNEFTASN